MIRINLITRADKARLASRRWRERNPELALSRPRNSVLSHLCPHGRTRKIDVEIVADLSLIETGI